MRLAVGVGGRAGPLQAAVLAAGVEGLGGLRAFQLRPQQQCALPLQAAVGNAAVDRRRGLGDFVHSFGRRQLREGAGLDALRQPGDKPAFRLRPVIRRFRGIRRRFSQSGLE